MARWMCHFCQGVEFQILWRWPFNWYRLWKWVGSRLTPFRPEKLIHSVHVGWWDIADKWLCWIAIVWRVMDILRSWCWMPSRVAHFRWHSSTVNRSSFLVWLTITACICVGVLGNFLLKILLCFGLLVFNWFVSTVSNAASFCLATDYNLRYCCKYSKKTTL